MKKILPEYPGLKFNEVKHDCGCIDFSIFPDSKPEYRDYSSSCFERITKSILRKIDYKEVTKC